MKQTFLFLTTIALLASSACSTERMKENLYEGIQSRSQSLKSPQEKSIEPPPQSYRDYEKERERLRNQPKMSD